MSPTVHQELNNSLRMKMARLTLDQKLGLDKYLDKLKNDTVKPNRFDTVEKKLDEVYLLLMHVGETILTNSNRCDRVEKTVNAIREDQTRPVEENVTELPEMPEFDVEKFVDTMLKAMKMNGFNVEDLSPKANIFTPLNDYVKEAHTMAKEKGWWDGGRGIPECLALIHSEVSEALEDYRDGNMCLKFGQTLPAKPYGFPTELADILIRVFDLAGSLQIDLDAVVRTKMAYNATRPVRHGGKNA